MTPTKFKNDNLVEIKSNDDHSPKSRDSHVDDSITESSSDSSKNLNFNSVLHHWINVSKINFLSVLALDDISKDRRFRNIALTNKHMTMVKFNEYSSNNNDNLPIEQKFPVNVTSLMNVNNLWGCFYNFPELYNDVYSPVIQVMDFDKESLTECNVLTKETIISNLTYLKRTPILGDYVCIKLDLSLKFLTNIDILQNYKYLVYLDLSSNLLTELHVLSHLLYLQYLSVNFNKLETVLDYDTPQWFLTDVHYSYNSVTEISDLSLFWSITILDLSHNNIKSINGLEHLRYLRRLNLSFNHIECLKNLNHLRLLWLDVSYNNISSFEYGTHVGLRTLLHLEYLNINENNLKSMQIFSGCIRLRELHARNNRFDELLELVLYMRKLRRLNFLDFRMNPVCRFAGYKDAVISIFPLLLHLDGENLDPIDVRSTKMNTTPDVFPFTLRRLLRLLYIEQLSRAKISPHIPPADSVDMPMIVLVGYEGVGKGSLARRIVKEHCLNIKLAVQHTTAISHFTDHYKVITRKNFDDMLLAGEFLTYGEIDGESYGLSRKEAFVNGCRGKIVTIDLVGALMLKLRGYRPYLILTLCSDAEALRLRQEQRKRARNLGNKKKTSDFASDMSMLQVLVSSHIIINGILNEIVQKVLCEDKFKSESDTESEYTFFENVSERNKRTYVTDKLKLLNAINNEDLSNDIQIYSSLLSLFKEYNGMDEFISEDLHRISVSKSLSKKFNEPKQSKQEHGKAFTKYTAKGSQPMISRNTSKSVTFTSPEQTIIPESNSIKSLKELIESDHSLLKSMSFNEQELKSCFSDLWLTFMLENNLIHLSDLNLEGSELPYPHVDLNNINILKKMKYYAQEIPCEAYSTTIRDNYEDIHRKCPGLFWETINMDDPNEAFKKLKNIIKSQKSLKPLYDIDFMNNKDYHIITQKVENIRHQIATQQLFY